MTKVEFITLEKLLEMKENNEDFEIVEALGEDSYEKGHIPGAVNIPTEKDMSAEDMKKRAKDKGIDKDTPVVTYCANYQCTASTRAAELLAEAGYKSLDFKAGKKGWKEAGFDLE